MPSGNPNIRNLKRGIRLKTADETFFFKVNDTLRVTRDRHNLIIALVYTVADSGRKYQMNKSFCSTISGVYSCLKDTHEVDDSTIEALRKRLSGVTESYVNGRLILTVPEEVVGDAHDVLSDSTNGEDDNDDEKTDKQ